MTESTSAVPSTQQKLIELAVEFDPYNNFCFKHGTQWVPLSDALTLLADASALKLPEGLHQMTADLVTRFAQAMGEKLYAAQQKYGYDVGWSASDWMDECRDKLLEHIEKGDPRDVANYCAFLWYHSQPTYTGKPRTSSPSATVTPLSAKEVRHLADAEWDKRGDRIMEFYAGAPLKTQVRMGHQEGFMAGHRSAAPEIAPKS